MFYFNISSVVNGLIHIVKFSAHSLQNSIGEAFRCEVIREQIRNTAAKFRADSCAIECGFYFKSSVL